MSSIHNKFQKITFNAGYFYFTKFCIKTQGGNDQGFLPELLGFNSGSICSLDVPAPDLARLL
jgi:hypothetical protein